MMLHKWWRRVAVLVIVVAMLGTGRSGSASPGWPTNYRSALETARREGKPLVIDFGSATCPACRMLERRTLSHPEVQSALSDFVRVYVDGNEHVSLRESFGVQYYPTLLYLSPEGKVLKRQVGFVGPEEMSSVLREVAARVPSHVARSAAVAQASARDSAPANSAARKVAPGNFYEIAAASGAKQPASAQTRQARIIETVREPHQRARMELVGDRDKPDTIARGGGEERLVAQALPVPSNVETPKPLVEVAPSVTPASSPPPAQPPKSALPDAIKKVQAATPAQPTPAPAKPSPTSTKAPEKAASNRTESSSAERGKSTSETKATPRSASAEKKSPPSSPSPATQRKESDRQQARLAGSAQEVSAEDIERWFADAESKLMAGYKKEARAMYAKVVERDPTNKFGKSDLAYIKMVALMVDREDDELRRTAHAKIKEFLKRYPNSPHKDYYTVVRAMLAADLGDYAEAHALLDRFPQEFPESRYQDLARTVWQELPKDPRSLQKKATPVVAQSGSAKPSGANKSSAASSKASTSAAKPTSSAQGTKTTKGANASSASGRANSSSSAKKSATSSSSAKKPASTPSSAKKSSSSAKTN